MIMDMVTVHYVGFGSLGAGMAYIIMKLHNVKFDFLIRVWKNGKDKQ